MRRIDVGKITSVIVAAHLGEEAVKHQHGNGMAGLLHVEGDLVFTHVKPEPVRHSMLVSALADDRLVDRFRAVAEVGESDKSVRLGWVQSLDFHALAEQAF